MRKILVAVVALAGAAAGTSDAQPTASEVPPARIAAAEFAARPSLEDPLLSPDGRRIAARAIVRDKVVLVVLDADNPTGRQIEAPIGDADLADVNWAGNQRLLLTLLTTGNLFGLPIPAFRLVAYDLPTRRVTALDTKSRGLLAGDVLYVEPEGRWALVASQDDMQSYPSVKRVDLVSGESALVEKARPHLWDWYADSKGVLRGGIAYADRRWTLWYRDDPGQPLRAIKGKYKKADSAIDRVIFGRKKDSGAVITNEITGRFAAYKYDFETGAVGDPIYEHAEVDISEVLLEPETGKIRGVRYEDDRWRTHWIDPELKELQAKLDRALPNSVNEIVSLSKDANRALILSEKASDPPTYFLLDRQAAKMHPVIDPYERIEPEGLAPVQPEKYLARDGLTIPAYVTLPRGRDSKALPLIVLPHGGPFQRDTWGYDPLVQFLANRGYAVLQPQFRGSTGYGKDFVESGYGQWGRKMQDDLDDGVDWLVRSGKVDPKRVCIIGASYGGYAALWGAIRNPDRYRCAVSLAGVSDLRAQLRDNRKSFSATRYFREWRTIVAGEGKVDLRAVSPIHFAQQMKVPVLIAHGVDDSVVSVKQSRAMVAALEKAKANVTSVYYKTGHDWTRSEDFEDYLKRLEAFLSKNNPA